jgi:hypothetical protein
MEEDYKLLRIQENMYWMSPFLKYKWYRKLYGGRWRFLKLGRDTPYINLFCTWTKMDDSHWKGPKEVIYIEDFEYTGVVTRCKLLGQFFKNIFKMSI